MTQRVHLAKPEHEVAYQDVCALISKHAETLTPLELLAIAGNMIGKLIALQDQRVTSKNLAMRTLMANLEHGNGQAVAQVENTKGSA